MRFADCGIRISLHGRDIPIISISQIRRLAEQEGFEAKLFITGFRNAKGDSNETR